MPTPLTDGHRSTGLVDVLDRVLDKGLVVAGDIKVSLAEVELLTIRIRPLFWLFARNRVPSGNDFFETLIVWRLLAVYMLYRCAVRTRSPLSPSSRAPIRYQRSSSLKPRITLLIALR